MGNPIVHFEVNGADGAKLNDFYGQLFGWQINADNPMGYGLVDTASGGKGIAGGIGAGQGSWVTVYAETPDVAATLDRAAALGAQVVMPSTPVMEMVTLGMFADPEGQLIGLVQSSDRPAPEWANAGGSPVVHFEIVGQDDQQLFAFYRDLFGWKIDANNPMNYGIVDTDSGGKGIAGGVSAGGDQGSWVTFYAEVPDPQATLDKAVALGGSVVMPVTEIPGMVTLATFKDPEGHLIGIVKEGSM